MTGTADPLAAELPAAVPVSYPGVFRPVPPFTIEVPPLWVFGEFPGALFTFGPQPRPDGAWVNVVVRHERISPETNIADIAKSTWEELTAHAPELVLGEEWFLELREVHYVRQVEIPATRSTDSLTRFDSFVQSPQHHATNDLFHLTWLLPTANLPEFEVEMAKILASFRFD